MCFTNLRPPRPQPLRPLVVPKWRPRRWVVGSCPWPKRFLALVCCVSRRRRREWPANWQILQMMLRRSPPFPTVSPTPSKALLSAKVPPPSFVDPAILSKRMINNVGTIFRLYVLDQRRRQKRQKSEQQVWSAIGNTKIDIFKNLLNGLLAFYHLFCDNAMRIQGAYRQLFYVHELIRYRTSTTVILYFLA